MMQMILAIHKSLDYFDFVIPGLIAAVRRLVAVVLVHFAGCRHPPSLLAVLPQHVSGLQV